MREALGAIAQLVEQRTENPCVPSSILGGTTGQAITSLPLIIMKISALIWHHQFFISTTLQVL